MSDIEARIIALEDRHPGLEIRYNPEHDTFTLTHEGTDTQTSCCESVLEGNAEWLVMHTATATKFDALNTDIIDIEGIGTVDISKLSFVGVALLNGDFMRFDVIVDGLQLFWITTDDAYTSLLTAMRGRP